ncbi:putative quinol monooxygenase [Rhodoblastus sp.]|uniref:putative quinol monooxygenase n=1 Tax=Rhodoblastus sp. TaxID=1962975 RepID=UPI003F9901FC
MSLLSLTSQWFIKPGLEIEAIQALRVLAADVRRGEPDTLVYLVHEPHADTRELVSLPPSVKNLVLFFEVYRDVPAFIRHVNGPIFTNFVKEHGKLFVEKNDQPYTTVAFLNRRAGFVRKELSEQDEPIGSGVNTHPGPAARPA